MGRRHAKTVSWSYDVEGHARKCVERYCAVANKEAGAIVKKFQVLACMIIMSGRRNLNQSKNYPNYAHTLSSNACTWHELVELTFHGQRTKLARSVTTWTGARDRGLADLISYLHHTSDYRQCCHVGNTAQHCRLGLSQDSDFAGDFEDSTSTSGEGP